MLDTEFQQIINDLHSLERVNVTIPIDDKVLILPEAADSTSKGGIIIPTLAQEEKKRGMVIAVGQHSRGEEMTVKMGDLVTYSKFAGTEVDVHGVKLMVIRQSDIAYIYARAVEATETDKAI